VACKDTINLLVGGAIGFISAVLAPMVIEPIKYLLWGPKLRLQFDERDKSFVTETKENVIDSTSNKVRVRDAHYIRILAVNTGRQIANHCRAYLVGIERWDNKSNRFEPTIYCDSLQLAWSAQGNSDGYRPLDLPPKINQFIDILSTSCGEANYDMKTNPKLMRYVDLFKEYGKYQYTIQVAGDNFKPSIIKIIFVWNGVWNNFSVSSK
jgi:hypothetical protein